MVAFLPFLSLVSLLLSSATALHVFDSDLTAYETATLSWEEGTAPYVVDIIPSGSSGSVLTTLTNSTWDTSIDWFVAIDAGISVTISVKDAAGENAYSSSLTVSDAASNSTSSVGAESSSVAEWLSSAAVESPSSAAWPSEAPSTKDEAWSTATVAAASESSSAAAVAPTTISGLATSAATSTPRSSSARSSSSPSVSSAAASASASAAGGTSSGASIKAGVWTLTAAVVLVGSFIAA